MRSNARRSVAAAVAYRVVHPVPPPLFGPLRLHARRPAAEQRLRLFHAVDRRAGRRAPADQAGQGLLPRQVLRVPGPCAGDRPGQAAQRAERRRGLRAQGLAAGERAGRRNEAPGAPHGGAGGAGNSLENAREPAETRSELGLRKCAARRKAAKKRSKRSSPKSPFFVSDCKWIQIRRFSVESGLQTTSG